MHRNERAFYEQAHCQDHLTALAKALTGCHQSGSQRARCALPVLDQGMAVGKAACVVKGTQLSSPFPTTLENPALLPLSR